MVPSNKAILQLSIMSRIDSNKILYVKSSDKEWECHFPLREVSSLVISVKILNRNSCFLLYKPDSVSLNIWMTQTYLRSTLDLPQVY